MVGVGGTFFTREPGEVVIRVVHHHWFIFFYRALRYVLAASIPPVIILLATTYLPSLLDVFYEGELAWPLLILGASVMYLLIWLALFGEWVDFYLAFLSFPGQHQQGSIFARVGLNGLGQGNLHLHDSIDILATFHATIEDGGAA